MTCAPQTTSRQTNELDPNQPQWRWRDGAYDDPQTHVQAHASEGKRGEVDEDKDIEQGRRRKSEVEEFKNKRQTERYRQ